LVFLLYHAAEISQPFLDAAANPRYEVDSRRCRSTLPSQERHHDRADSGEAQTQMDVNRFGCAL